MDEFDDGDGFDGLDSETEDYQPDPDDSTAADESYDSETYEDEPSYDVADDGDGDGDGDGPGTGPGGGPDLPPPSATMGGGSLRPRD